MLKKHQIFVPGILSIEIVSNLNNHEVQIDFNYCDTDC